MLHISFTLYFFAFCWRLQQVASGGVLVSGAGERSPALHLYSPAFVARGKFFFPERVAIDKFLFMSVLG